MLSMVIHVLRTSPKDDGMGIWGLFFFLAPAILIGITTRTKQQAASAWDNDIFDGNAPFSRDNLMEAYICLGARIIRSDRKDYSEKIMYMNKYFQRHFPDSLYNFGSTLSHNIKNPPNVRVVSKWLRMHLRQKEKRLQVMYFLVGMAMLDGRYTERELNILQGIADILELSPKEFDSIIGMYKSYDEEKRSVPRMPSRKTALQLSAQVLGISEHASFDEAKKAYRKLVKLHHPDRFVNDVPEQQKLAEQRFIKIQKAYEVFEKYK